MSTFEKVHSEDLHNNGVEEIILGGGCFWCVEAAYQMVPGVKSVVSGYAGGHVKNPDYKLVSSGTTGHAEVVKIIFDPSAVSLRELIDIFWVVHDPTTPNRQGADIGPQYRSIIIMSDETKQRPIIEASLKDAQKKFSSKIVTELVSSAVFYPAEDYHQNFYRNNTFHPYCRAVIDPKLEKVKNHLGVKHDNR